MKRQARHDTTQHTTHNNTNPLRVHTHKPSKFLPSHPPYMRLSGYLNYFRRASVSQSAGAIWEEESRKAATLTQTSAPRASKGNERPLPPPLLLQPRFAPHGCYLTILVAKATKIRNLTIEQGGENGSFERFEHRFSPTVAKGRNKGK